jgi:hypothetical protein
MSAKPSFVAFTGVDSAMLISDMQTLSRHYPIEWGILIDDAKSDDPLFADVDIRARLLESSGLRFAAHVCGEQAGLIANEPDHATIDLTRFQRLQVNHGFSGGIRSENARSVVDAIAAPEGAQYWIDMESGVRTDGRFDLGKCEAVCRAVFD